MGIGSIQFKRPSFTLQVTLLVLPLLVLSVMGFISLRQDKAFAEHEAAVRAQAIADDLLAAFASDLVLTNAAEQPSVQVFKLDEAGHLAEPRSRVLPVPRPLNKAALTLQQSALWAKAQSLEIQEHATTNLIEAYKAFLASSPPGDFEAAGYYSMGVALEKANQSSAAIEAFKYVPHQLREAVGVTGLALAPIAQLKSIDWTAASAQAEFLAEVDTFCSNVVARPTILSSTLLAEALQKARSKEVLEKIQVWQERWQRDELSREIGEAAMSQQQKNGEPLPQWFWVVTTSHGPLGQFGSDLLTNVTPADFNWVVSRRASAQNTHARAVSNSEIPSTAIESNSFAPAVVTSNLQSWFVSQTESQLETRLYSIVRNMRRIPEYFGVSVSVAGKNLAGPPPGLRLWHEVGYFGRRGGGVKKEYLAENATKVLASATHSEPGKELLGVSVWLTSPETLYRNQRARTFWFAAIISVSSLGAVLGLLALWRGFSRQVSLNQLKSNFVSSVPHEVPAPIASVRLMAESLETGKVSEPQKREEYYRFIGQECRRLSSLIENVLDFARIEQGRKQYELEPTEILALMRQTLAPMDPYAAERQVALKLRMNAAAWEAVHPVIDGRAIQQALVNLLDNAIKHSPPGREVTVGLERIEAQPENGQPGSTGAIELWVEDSGPGIPRDEHEKIFKRFYRLGSELRRETPGVGIGLSIVKHIVDAHGGKISVRSAPGEGSRFTIRLPQPLEIGDPVS